MLRSITLAMIAAAWLCWTGSTIRAQDAPAKAANKSRPKAEKPAPPPADETPAEPDAPAEDDDAKDADDGSKFIRLNRNENDDPIAMQTAIVRYVRPGKPAAGGKPAVPETTVDLVGVVHVGEKAYYEDLNRRFEAYDALLYELVAPEHVVPKKTDEGGGILSMVQRGMKNMLELEFQLDWIDYGAENFVHADMSPNEFAKSMADRGESIWTILLQMMTQSMAMQAQNANQNVEAELLLALFDKNRALKLKRIVAEQFQDVETAMEIFEGPNGSVIITERNKKALKVLSKQLADGKRKLGIFYGAGHMVDLEARLIDEFGFKRESEEWLTAWDLADKKPKEPDAPTKPDAPKKPADAKSSE